MCIRDSCKACVLFAPDQAGGQDLGQFVTSPFKCWTVFSSNANAHAGKNYHRDAMTKMNAFIAGYENPSQTVDTALNREAQHIMESNQKVLESLLKVVMLCGKQGLSLRGHRDDKVFWEVDSGGPNEGNFIQLVRFRAETDTILANHLSKAPKNTIYTLKPFRMI